MQIVRITVHAGCTFNHPHESYSNFRPGITLEAEVRVHDGISNGNGRQTLNAYVSDLQRTADDLLMIEKRRILDGCTRAYKIDRLKDELAAGVNNANDAISCLQQLEPVTEFPARIQRAEWPARVVTSDAERKAFVGEFRRQLKYADRQIADARAKLKQLGVSDEEIDQDCKRRTQYVTAPSDQEYFDAEAEEARKETNAVFPGDLQRAADEMDDELEDEDITDAE